MDAPPDPGRCPLCQGANSCAAAEGKSSCWCETVEIPAEVLDRVPEAAKRRACVCKACAGDRPAARKLSIAR
ncbi:MAG TPA: cysteine-rich CWC family protein [Polyangiaceae bacterium]